MAKVIDVPAPVELAGDSKQWTLARFLETALDLYEPLGLGIKQIRQGVKIHGVLGALDGQKALRFEDADFEVVKAACEACKWTPKAGRCFLPFFDALEKAQDVKL